MSEELANELRNCGHEIIIRLFEAKKVEHLNLLMEHCRKAIEEIGTANTRKRKVKP